MQIYLNLEVKGKIIYRMATPTIDECDPISDSNQIRILYFEILCQEIGLKTLLTSPMNKNCT